LPILHQFFQIICTLGAVSGVLVTVTGRHSYHIQANYISLACKRHGRTIETTPALLLI